MDRVRQSLPVILIVSSIVLLITFQFFWLRGVYKEAEDRFRKEAFGLFRSTVVTLYDSMIENRIEPLKQDTMVHLPSSSQFTIRESKQIKHIDSTRNYITFREQESRVELFVSSADPDSIRKVMSPIIRRFEKDKGKSFILKLGPDSLKVDSIEAAFTVALSDAGMRVPFDVKAHPHATSKTIQQLHDTGPFQVVRINPFNQYTVDFADVEGFVLRTITPQIIFSIILTLTTMGAFYVMYRSLRAQQRLMQLKNDFISNVTHELKTPVATVSVALEALKNFNALHDQRRTDEYLDIAQNELNRLTLMTDKILKTSVYESHGVEMKFKPVSLDEITLQVVNSMKLVFEKKRITLTFEKHGADFRVDGSEVDLTNVLYNLIDNALKYSTDGSSVTVNLTAAEKTVELTITDTGIGIPSEYHDKIFEKFFRVPSGDVHNIKGYGLGLSYVHSVIKSHHGTIEVSSSPGHGSAFHISLPRHHDTSVLR